MPIEIKKGDIFKQPVEAIVNPVNCDGVMGAGLSKKFKEKFPDNFSCYRRKCVKGQLKPGIMCVTIPINDVDKQLIINFPTKDKWSNPSKLEYVSKGLDSLLQTIYDHEIKSIAIPALGCGLGGLEWKEVKSLIIEKLFVVDNVDIIILEP